MKQRFLLILAVALFLGLSAYVGASAGTDYERNHLESLRQQNRLLERQNELLRDQAEQMKRIADLMQKAQR